MLHGGLGQKLRYKCEESQHAILVKVDTYFPSSHLCHNTGLKLDRKLLLSERRWECPHCGELHDRDLTAAINVHKEALRLAKVISLEAYSGQIVPVVLGAKYISKTP
jgi:putative transposase